MVTPTPRHLRRFFPLLVTVLAFAGTGTAIADQPVITQPVEGGTVDTSKPGRIIATADPGQNISLQICQLRAGQVSSVPGNRCSMASLIMGGNLMNGTLEEVTGKPGTYQYATDLRCSLGGFSSDRPVYLRAVAVPKSVIEARDWYSNPQYFQTYASPDGSTGSTERLDVWGAQVGVMLAEPPPTFIKPVAGISINDASTYTNTPEVSIDVQPTPCVTPYPTKVALSNDGGFKESSVISFEDFSGTNGAARVKWKLLSTGKERLPKTVYANIGGVRFTDDIILDERDPTIQSASLTGGAASASARAGRFKIKLSASDTNSGVGRAQAAVNKAKPGSLVSYRKLVTVSSPGKPKWVRVQDRAGNFSKWKKLR